MKDVYVTEFCEDMYVRREDVRTYGVYRYVAAMCANCDCGFSEELGRYVMKFIISNGRHRICTYYILV